MEPSVPTYYFGSERQGFFEVTRPPLFFPKEPLPLPNCTWKDYTAELSLPYEGEMRTRTKKVHVNASTEKELTRGTNLSHRNQETRLTLNCEQTIFQCVAFLRLRLDHLTST